MLEVIKENDANAVVKGKIAKETIEKKSNEIAKKVAKTASIQGFRKGKVPTKAIKQFYGEKIFKDAENEAFMDIYDEILKDLNITKSDIINEPIFTKYDKDDGGNIEFELHFYIKPKINLSDYKSLIPEIKVPEVNEDEIENELKKIAEQYPTIKPLEEKRALKKGDIAVIDFEGFLDGTPFEGGKAENYELEIGSKTFVGDFEEKLIDMQYDEEKEISVTFPENYTAKELAGKETIFKVKLNQIKQKILAEINDDLAKKVFNKENATLEELKNDVKNNLQSRKKQDYYMNELKEKYLEALLEKIEFDVPHNIVDQEIEQLANSKTSTMSEEELEKLKNDKEAIKKLTDELRPDAIKSVKVTFLIDALAKAEKVDVSDEEVTQTLYYEAIMSGQEPKKVIEQYEKAGYLPVIKMSIIENRLLTKIFDEAGK